MGGYWSSNEQPTTASREAVMNAPLEEKRTKRSRRLLESVGEETDVSPKR